MVPPPSGLQFMALARKTLSRDNDDARPIPNHYLRALVVHLAKYPYEDNFLLDLEDEGGILTCLDCYVEVVLAVNRELKDFRAFWEHLATPSHQTAAANRKPSMAAGDTPEDPMDVDMECYQPPTREAAYAQPPRRRTQKKKIRRRVPLSDGEYYEYDSTTDEVILEPQPASTYASSSSTLYNTGAPPHAISQTNTYPNPYSMQASASNTSIDPWWSGWDDFPPTSSNSFPDPSFRSPSVKRPRQGIRRFQYSDGEVIYVSTDDETVDERPEAIRNKRLRSQQEVYGSNDAALRTYATASALPNNANGSSMSYYSPSVPPSSSPLKYEPGPSQSNSLQPGRIRLGGGLMKVNGVTVVRHSAPRPSFPSSSSNGLAQSQPSASAYVPPMPGAFYDNEDLYGWGGYANGAPGTRGPGMDYHAPPVNGDNQAGMVGYDSRFGAGMFNGNYDEHSISNLDIGEAIPHSGLKDFLASAMEALQETPTVTEAAKRLGLTTVNSPLPYLEVPLMPHQVIGVDWMLQQEKKKWKGGILADDMGLGKTLQCIALCTINQPPDNLDCKSNLIIAPTALLEQWKREIEQRTTAGQYKVFIHHGNHKLKSTSEVKTYDFVITTYTTLCLEFPKPRKKNEQGDLADVEDSDYENNENLWGPLAKTRWYRIVLDEAQYIRNRSTRGSKCVARLHATYRWALTGTPVTNKLADLYSLMRFLRAAPFNEWSEYNSHIASVEKNNPTLAGTRAQLMLEGVLLRRNKNATVEGRRILELPPKEIEIVEVEFSAEERQIYETIELRQQQKMSKYLKAGTVMKNYAVILVMLLRLRQACNHPQLLLAEEWEGGDRVLEGNSSNTVLDMTPAGELNRAERLCGAQFVEEVKAKFREQARARIQDDVAEEEDTDCPICFDTYVNNCRITSCKHLFCGDCLNDLFKSPPTGSHAEDDAYIRANQTGQRSCPVCRRDIFPDKVFKSAAFEPSEEELNMLRGIQGDSSNIDAGQNGMTSDVKGKVKAVAKGDTDIEEMLNQLDKGDQFEPSVKMVKMVEYIKLWRKSAPDDKIICYSQWTSMISLVEKLFARDAIETVRFDGKMTRIARDEAISKFKRRNGPPVMLISLKCGGVGLNLVEANRVLSLDLAWNAATENQAFDRVHRMGQQKDVHVKRLIVKNTVEERILGLQGKKQSLADAALGEGTGQKIKKMTVAELKMLFGM